MNNGFKGYHPLANLIFFVSVAVFGMLFKHPFTLLICFACAFCYYVLLCKKAAVKSFFLFLLPMLVFVVAVNGLFAHYGTTVLLTLPDGNKMTLEALVYGFALAASTVSIIMWFFCYNEVVTTDKFMHLFGKVLPAAALVISMALRFLPMYKNKYTAIAEAQSGIGKDNTKGSFIEKIRNTGKLISALATVSLENAVETSDSMRARGYGLKGRKSYGKFKLRTKDIITVSITLLLDIIMTAGYVMKSVYCIYDPYIVINPSASGTGVFIEKFNLTINPLSGYGAVTLAAFTLLCFLPLIIELWEGLKWNRSKLKI